MQALETVVNGIESMGGRSGQTQAFFSTAYLFIFFNRFPNYKACTSINLLFSCRCILFHDERWKRWEANYKDIRVEEVTAAVLVRQSLRPAPLSRGLKPFSLKTLLILF